MKNESITIVNQGHISSFSFVDGVTEIKCYPYICSVCGRRLRKGQCAIQIKDTIVCKSCLDKAIKMLDESKAQTA